MCKYVWATLLPVLQQEWKVEIIILIFITIIVIIIIMITIIFFFGTPPFSSLIQEQKAVIVSFLCNISFLLDKFLPRFSGFNFEKWL